MSGPIAVSLPGWIYAAAPSDEGDRRKWLAAIAVAYAANCFPTGRVGEVTIGFWKVSVTSSKGQKALVPDSAKNGDGIAAYAVLAGDGLDWNLTGFITAKIAREKGKPVKGKPWVEVGRDDFMSPREFLEMAEVPVSWIRD